MNNVTKNRHIYTGGSDLPSILGYNIKYKKTPFLFANIKAGIIQDDFKGNQYTKYGTKMEKYIRDYINADLGYNFVEASKTNEVLKLRGNADGVDYANNCILEVKTCGKNFDVDYYEPQCQFYMAMFNIDKCLLVAYERPEDFYTGLDFSLEKGDEYFNWDFEPENITIHEIDRDEVKWQNILYKVQKMQEAIIKLKENNEMTEEEFNTIFQDKKVLDAQKELFDAKKKLDEITAKYNKAKDELGVLFEERDLKTLENDDYKVTKVDTTTTTKLVFDEKSFKKDEPDLYDDYLIERISTKGAYLLITTKKKD